MAITVGMHRLPAAPPLALVLPSPAELEAEGVAHLLELEASGDLRARHTYLYASAADLSLVRHLQQPLEQHARYVFYQDDVVRLLEQYKKLALHYEALRAAVSVRHVASSEAAEPPVVLPPLGTGNGDVLPPASDAGEPESSPGSMLKLLNPFTRVPRAIKGTLSLLDGTTSLIPSSAVAAWSTAAPKSNLTLQEIPTGALDDDVSSASQRQGAAEWQPPEEDALSQEAAVPEVEPATVLEEAAVPTEDSTVDDTNNNATQQGDATPSLIDI